MNAVPPISPPLTSRGLQLIWMVDCSGSMRLGGKMAALAEAARASLPLWRATARAYPEAAVTSQLLRFSDEATWVDPAPVALEDFAWPDLVAQGATALGAALELLSQALAPASSPSYPPLVILLTDGLATDEVPSGAQKLFATEAGAGARRFMVAIGRDAGTPEALEQARAFLGPTEAAPLLARHADALQNQLRYLATVGLRSVLAPKLEIPGAAAAALPALSLDSRGDSSAEELW